MPLVKIYARDNKNDAELRAIGDGVHDALVAQANVPADDRFQVLNRLDRHLIVAHPSYGGVNRSENIVIIEITLNAGRTVEVKKKLYADIAARLERLGVRPDDLLVSLIEVTKENWSF